MSRGQTHVQDTSNCPVNHSQQTRDTELMMFQRWASVADGGTTLKQHRLSDYWVALTYIVYYITQSKQTRDIHPMQI